MSFRRLGHNATPFRRACGRGHLLRDAVSRRRSGPIIRLKALLASEHERPGGRPRASSKHYLRRITAHPASGSRSRSLSSVIG